MTLYNIWLFSFWKFLAWYPLNISLGAIFVHWFRSLSPSTQSITFHQKLSGWFVLDKPMSTDPNHLLILPGHTSSSSQGLMLGWSTCSPWTLLSNGHMYLFPVTKNHPPSQGPSKKGVSMQWPWPALSHSDITYQAIRGLHSPLYNTAGHSASFHETFPSNRVVSININILYANSDTYTKKHKWYRQL